MWHTVYVRLKRNDLTAEFVRTYLDYDPETGIFTWRAKINIKGRYKPGYVASSRNRLQIMIGIKGAKYCGHRLAWLWMTGSWPEAEIDHINRDRFDNRWVNLRAATRGQNNTNKGHYSLNPFKGVQLDPRRGKWRARIKLNGREKHLGYFDTAEEAAETFRKAAQEHWGAFHSMR